MTLKDNDNDDTLHTVGVHIQVCTLGVGNKPPFCRVIAGVSSLVMYAV
jgi:hypothetical protein